MQQTRCWGRYQTGGSQRGPLPAVLFLGPGPWGNNHFPSHPRGRFARETGCSEARQSKREAAGTSS
eukprot:1572029-Pyramimonas_sp.AAC.1